MERFAIGGSVRRWYYLFLAILSSVVISCQSGPSGPSLDESGGESATEVPPAPAVGGGPALPNIPQTATKNLLINQAMVLRYEKNGILESVIEIPAETQIEIPENYEVKYLDFRNSNGGIERSSTGFIEGVRLISVAPQFQPQFTPAKIAAINATPGGLFLFASIVGSLTGTEGAFNVITPASLGAGFVRYYGADGKPKFKVTSSINKRFGARVNKGIAPKSLPTATREKWARIYHEVRRAVDRTVVTPKSYLMIAKADADLWSLAFEKNGVISPSGAWSIAVQSTAVRHGFSNVPCAEFQSEILRQAYQRAGYRVTDDFSSAKGNPLIWSYSAAVENFSKALYQAGWVPWDASVYKPPVGAFLMNEAGNSPGHTYAAASDDGTVIVDNGAPQGRDLRKTTESTIGMMYRTGVFFLPPGINPVKW